MISNDDLGILLAVARRDGPPMLCAALEELQQYRAIEYAAEKMGAHNVAVRMVQMMAKELDYLQERLDNLSNGKVP
jgi:hypothetical protein